tara:strand:+ start:14 stop:481 length:468 start_codon:yes stop_codon:yes gene_type:complete
MITLEQIRESKHDLKVTAPGKVPGSFFPDTVSNIKGKVIKFNYGGDTGAGIGTKRLIKGNEVPGLQAQMIPAIKKNKISAFVWGGTPKGVSWLRGWIKGNKNVELTKGQVVRGIKDQDISSDILQLFRDFNKKFGGKDAYMHHNAVILYFVEVIK